MLHSPRRKALVLGHDTRAFLSVVRSLGRAGIEVHVAWCDPNAPAARSRHIARLHRIPAYRAGRDDWKPAFKALMRAERFDLVIPCDDQTTLPLAANREELEQSGRIALPDARALAVLGDKRRTTALARSLGIPVPDEEVVSSMDEAGRLRGRFRPPLIVKPPASYSLEDVDMKRMVRRARSWPEAERYLTDAFADGPAVVQEFLPGRGVGLELLARAGEPVLAFQHVRLHEPLEGGGSTYRESVPVSHGLLDAATRLLRELEYTGVAMAEFRVEPVTGRWALLEVNARFWGSLPLAVAAGADFPRALFELLVDGEAKSQPAYRTRLRARNIRADLKWHYQNLRSDRGDPTLESRPWPGVVRETLDSILGGRERSDTFTVDDPAPGLAEATQLGVELARELRLRADRLRARVDPRHRRRLREAAADALRSSRRVLFVCRGNIARSPFAAALVARQLPDGREVHSAGFLPAGRISPPAAVAAAALWDVDLSGHRSRPLTPELVDGSDAIFVFDGRNLTDLLSRHPEARDRVHLVGALDEDAEILIADPLPRGDGAFRPAYERIAAALTASHDKR